MTPIQSGGTAPDSRLVLWLRVGEPMPFFQAPDTISVTLSLWVLRTDLPVHAFYSSSSWNCLLLDFLVEALLPPPSKPPLRIHPLACSVTLSRRASISHTGVVVTSSCLG